MSNIKLESSDFPGLYQSSDRASLNTQSSYYTGLIIYLLLLVLAAFVSFKWPVSSYGAMASITLFLLSLGVLVRLRVTRPDDIWYNGRAVAESVKTRTWRWCMRSEPYQDCNDINQVSLEFISDLKEILIQNNSISSYLVAKKGVEKPITDTMKYIRSLPILERRELYSKERIDNQALWYASKSDFNKLKSSQMFWLSVFLHGVAIVMLVYRIKTPMSLPVEVVATAAGAILTWMQAKKYNELTSSYSLAAHEIALIKGEVDSINTEEKLSEFVLNSENAFSREHTQWVARKSE